MSQPIDTLAIEIEANAANSVDGVRKLSRALTSLSKSISSVNGAGIGNVASSLNSMSTAFNGVGSGSQNAASGTKKYANTLPSMVSHTNKAAHSAKSLAYYFGKFYANMFLVIRAFKAFGKTVTGTMNYMESFNFWDVAITSATGKTDEWKALGYEDSEAYAEAFKKGLADFNQKMTGFSTSSNGDISVSDNPNLGINLTNLTTFQAEIVSITSSLGLCTAVSEDTSKALSMLVADMSSLKNIDLDKVMKNFQSGLIGQSRALYKYGIDITNATLQTYAYQYGIDKAVSEMTQAEKMQLRMLAILDQSKVAWGDLANTLEQPANQFRVLKNGVKNLAITIGKLLMPMVSATLPYLNAMVNALQTFFTWTANILGIKLDVENTGTGTTDIFDDIEDGAEDATDSVNSLKKAMAQLGIDELNINNPNSDSGSSGSSVGSGVDLSTEINNALADYEKAWEEAYARVESRTKQLSDKILTFFQPVTDALRKYLKGEISFGELAGTITSFVITNLAEKVTDFLGEGVNWYTVGENIWDFIKTITWGEIVSDTIDLGLVTFSIIPKIVLGAVSEPITQILAKALGIDIEGAKKFLEQETKGKGSDIEINTSFIMTCVLDYLKDEWEQKKEEMREWLDNSIFKWFSLETWKNKSIEAITGLTIGWNVTKELFKKAVSKWWNEDVTPWFEEKKWQFDGIKKGLSSAWDAAVEAIKQLWNKFANWLNEKLTWTIDPVVIAGKTLFEGSTISLGKIPTFVNGGITSADIFAANENGVPELIGTIGRKSAIASGTEVTGIADAVYSTGETEASLLATAVSLLKEIADKDYNTYIGDREIAKANARGQRSMGYTLITEG